MVAGRRILLVFCVSSVAIGITIILANFDNRELSPYYQRVFLGRRSLLRNGDNLEYVAASRRGKFYDLSHFTDDEVSGVGRKQHGREALCYAYYLIQRIHPFLYLGSFHF